MAPVFQRDGRILDAKLEYNVVDHCNLRCDQCSHLSPYQTRRDGSLSTFVRDLALLEPVYRTGRFRFVGGEPLLNRQLPEFVRAVRDSGIAREIDIATNGVLLSRMSDSLITSVDRISVSCYPGHDDGIESQRVRCSDLGVRVNVERVSRFRQMNPASRISDERLIASIYHTCLMAHTWGCHTFSEGYFYVCSRPLFLDRYLELTGEAPGNFRTLDGIPLDQPGLRDRIARAITSDTPLAACAHCLGTVGRYQPWRETTSKRPTVQSSAVSISPWQSISRGRLRYLSVWRCIERVVLSILPSRHVARLMSLIQTATVRD